MTYIATWEDYNMCVIGYKPHGVEPITKEVLKLCWKQNKHGAGYAIYNNDETWRYAKGFMKWSHFWKAFKKEKVTKDTCYVVHFRIKSAGAITKQNTHPFVLSKDYRRMGKLSSKSEKVLIFHNGTCGRGEGSANDTMTFNKKYIYPLMQYPDDKALEDILSHLLTETRDRWFIVDGNSISRWGTWHDHEGSKFSNMIWKPYKRYTPKQPTGYLPAPSNSSGIRTGTGEAYDWNKNRNQNTAPVLVERTGTLLPDGTVMWDEDKTTPPEEIITMCPHCYEDKHLIDSPFQGMGDTMCERCGACFDDGSDTIIIHDQELLASYNKIRKAKQEGTV
jgi:hypothetical protein